MTDSEKLDLILKMLTEFTERKERPRFPIDEARKIWQTQRREEHAKDDGIVYALLDREKYVSKHLIARTIGWEPSRAGRAIERLRRDGKLIRVAPGYNIKATPNGAP